MSDPSDPASTPDSNTGSTAVVEPPKKAPAKPQSRPKRQPPYAVIVLNDEDHTFAYVIEGLIKFCNHKFERAYQLASQVHRTGKAVVWTGTLELAELKRDQLRGMGPDFYASRPVNYPLGVKLEPMP